MDLNINITGENNEEDSVSTREEDTSSTVEVNADQKEKAKGSPEGTPQKRRRENEDKQQVQIEDTGHIVGDLAYISTRTKRIKTEADEEGQSKKTEEKTKPDEKELIEIKRQVKAYQEHSVKTSEEIRKNIYNARYDTDMPSEHCLDECKTLIEYNESPEMYNYMFTVYEGKADALRTKSKLTDILPQHDIYKCMKMMARRTTFPKLAEMLYRFRYAAALAVARDTDGAIKEATKGYEILQQFRQDKTTAETMAKTSASCLYTYINVHLEKFRAKAVVSMTKEQDLKDYILKLISEGFQQIELMKDREEKDLWSRMYLVKETFCYLNIGFHCEDVFDPVELHITHEDKKKARRCLTRVKDYHWTNLDKRREMLYERAKAKLYWIDGDRSSAVKKLKKAVDIAANFKREEKVFIQILQKWEEDINSQ